MKYSTRKQLPIIIGLVFAVIASLAGLGYMAADSIGNPVADKFGCYAEVPASQTAHIMIDASYPRFSPQQQRSVYRYIEQTYNALKLGDKLAIYTSEDDHIASILEPRFHICGQAQSAGELAAINAGEVSNGYLAKQKQRLYQKVLLPELNTLISEKPNEKRKASSSPLLEMVKDFSNLPTIRQGDKLVLISDLLQNSRSVKPFCYVKGALPSFSTFSQWSSYKNQLKPKKLAVEVDILMLQRPTYGKFCTGSELQRFWVQFFKHNGVSSPNVISFRHGAGG